MLVGILLVLLVDNLVHRRRIWHHLKHLQRIQVRDTERREQETPANSEESGEGGGMEGKGGVVNLPSGCMSGLCTNHKHVMK